MALTDTDKKDIEIMIRKEIREFLNSNTLNQFEEKMIDVIRKEISRGRVENDIKDIVIRMLREFYGFMYTQRSYWESRLKSA
jgi:hypothetical protein